MDWLSCFIADVSATAGSVLQPYGARASKSIAWPPAYPGVQQSEHEGRGEDGTAAARNLALGFFSASLMASLDIDTRTN